MDDAPSDLSFSFARFADGFDSHIRKSIRGYNELLEDCVAFSEYFIDNDTSMFDIGCSTGSFLMHIWERNFRRAPQARYVGIDVEDSFAAQWEAYGAAGIEFKVADIRSFSIPDRCSLVTSFSPFNSSLNASAKRSSSRSIGVWSPAGPSSWRKRPCRNAQSCTRF